MANFKIVSSRTGKVYDIECGKDGENRQPCPECSKDRKKSSAKSFSFNVAKGVGMCQHCQVGFHVYKQQSKKKEYTVPVWKNRTALTDKAAKWFRSRMILDDVLNAMGVSSAVEYMPQTGKEQNVISFPYYRGDKLVNIKSRDANKNFRLVGGAELVFYNINAAIGQKELFIVEGEIDALSFIQSGVTNVVSVPNGAGSTSLEYIDNCYEELSHIERFIIAVDNDAAGFKLREELIRRLGSERCAVLSYEDCKDANEYLVKYGAFELGQLRHKSVDVPVEGVVTVEDIYDDVYNLWLKGFQPGDKIGFSELDELVTWVTGRLAVVTGVPGHGKSEFVDFIVSLMNVVHGWKVAFFSPENHPISYHVGKIMSKIAGRSFDPDYIKQPEFEKLSLYINDNYFFINPQEDITIDNILEKAKYLVRKHGIKILVIDPFNKLENMQSGNETETQYISRFLDKLTNFARVNGVLVFLVAHPRKMMQKKGEPGKYEVPTLYDISGSANFFNKADYGIVVYRDWSKLKTSVHIDKVKFKHWGKVGVAELEYIPMSGRYTSVGGEHSFRSWLDNKPKEEEVPF